MYRAEVSLQQFLQSFTDRFFDELCHILELFSVIPAVFVIGKFGKEFHKIFTVFFLTAVTSEECILRHHLDRLKISGKEMRTHLILRHISVVKMLLHVCDRFIDQQGRIFAEQRFVTGQNMLQRDLVLKQMTFDADGSVDQRYGISKSGVLLDHIRQRTKILNDRSRSSKVV
jgi:hypothetical protein